MSFASLVSPLLGGRALSDSEAKDLARYLFDDASPAQAGAALAMLEAKGPTSGEIAAFAREMRSRAVTIATEFPDLVDTCGTGGGIPSFNMSTAAALVAAGAGVRIAKHGNRAVTSKCGSADVLEELGVKLAHDPAELSARLHQTGIAFLFAPHHHPASAKLGPIRKELGFRTIFNVLGPLLNPAGAKRQIVGVYDSALLRPLAEALAALGSEHVLVVHGEDGLDEISPCAPTRWCSVEGGEVNEGVWSPTDFRLDDLSPEHLQPADSREEAAQMVRTAISDGNSILFQTILPMAAAAIVIGGKAEDLREGVELSRRSVTSGAAAEKLKELAS